MTPQDAPIRPAAASFLAGGGEAGALMRAQDWSSHPLGVPDTWPQPLKTTIGLMLNTGHPMCLSWGPELVFLYNDAYAPILTVRHPQAMGQPMAEVWADVWPDIAPLVDQTLAGEAIWQEDMHLVMSRDGRPQSTWWTFSYSPLRDEDGAVRGFVNVCNDMTGKILNERQLTAEREALREREAHYRALFNTIDDGFCVIQFIDGPHGPLSDYVHVEANPAYVVNAGIPDIVGKRLREIVGEDEADAWVETYRRVLVTGEAVRFERELIATGRHLDLAAFRVESPERRQVAVLFRDVSDRKRIEAAFAASRATLQAVYDNTPAGLIVAELPSGRLVESNRAVQEIFRHPMHRSESIEDYGVWESYDAAGQRTEARDYPLARTFATEAVAEGTYQFVRGDGTRAWLRIQTAPIRNAAGAMTGGVVAVTDVDEMIHAREALERLTVGLEAEVAARTAELRQFQDIVEATTSPICAFDAQYRLIAFNKAHNDEFRRVNGFDTKLGDVFPDLFIAEQQPVMRALMSRALSGERFVVTETFGRPEFGQPVWEISYTPLRDERGAIIGAFHLATDISDRLRAEADLATAQEALRHAQKMEAMGSLTGGVAHDFNNLLTPIVIALDLLGRGGFGGTREQRLIACAGQAASQATVLVQRLLAFARRQPLQPIAVDVSQLVHGMADLVASTTGPQIKVVVDVPGDLPRARTDPNQLEMALLNLAVNARDAMPDGGTLTLSAAAETIPAGSKGDLLPGRYIRLSVADTGIGMDEATLARAIEPFFSTKGIGKGTGLGLSMVHGFVSQLGGGLTIRSKPDAGTSIELWLPWTESAAEPQAAAPDAASAKGRGTVLLVDDEAIVRLSMADLLDELGYDVVEAESAEQALQEIESGAHIDLLITDNLMPGMKGTDLARTVAERWPQIRTLVVSGYSELEDVAPDLPRLTKPFRKNELAASLARLHAGKS